MRAFARAGIVICAAGFAAALFAHALLQRIAGLGFGATEFEHHAHGNVAPAMIVVAALFAMASAAFVRDAGRSVRGLIVARERKLGGGLLVALGMTVAIVATATLFGMEVGESQGAAVDFGWLGGNLLVGLAVLAFAVLTTTATVKLCSDARRNALDRTIALLSKMIRAIATRPQNGAAFALRREATSARIRAPYVGRNTGLRAPPLHTI